MLVSDVPLPPSGRLAIKRMRRWKEIASIERKEAVDIRGRDEATYDAVPVLAELGRWTRHRDASIRKGWVNRDRLMLPWRE